MDESIINNLYDKIDKIFIDHTTHQWKNGWQHEGDRESEELTIQKEVVNPSFAKEYRREKLLENLLD